MGKGEIGGGCWYDNYTFFSFPIITLNFLFPTSYSGPWAKAATILLEAGMIPKEQIV